MRKDQLGMASKSLEMTAALNPTYASAYTLLGQTYRRLETAKSQTAFQKSHSLQEKEIQDMHDKLPSEQELSEHLRPELSPHSQGWFLATSLMFEFHFRRVSWTGVLSTNSSVRGQ